MVVRENFSIRWHGCLSTSKFSYGYQIATSFTFHICWRHKQVFPYLNFTKHQLNSVNATFFSSGKTTLFLNTLKNIDTMYNPKPSKILFMYQEYQECYLSTQSELSKQGVEFECIKATDISLEDIATMCKDINGQIMVVYDDCTETTSSSAHVADMTMRGRHRCIRSSISAQISNIFLDTYIPLFLEMYQWYFCGIHFSQRGQKLV